MTLSSHVTKCLWTLVYRRSPWWRHQMETLSALLSLCEGNPVASDAEFWCFLWSAPEETVQWANTPDAGDFRRHRAHYGVTAMPRMLSVCGVTRNVTNSWSTFVAHNQTGPRFNIKTALQGMRISILTTILPLKWESIHWWDGIFILRRPPSSLIFRLKLSGFALIKWFVFDVLPKLTTFAFCQREHVF